MQDLGQPFLASLPHGSDQEGKKKENQSAGNAGNHLLPLEMNENRMPQNRHIVRGTCKIAGCSISCPTAIYLAVADWAWPGYWRRVLVACLCRARKD